MTETIARIAGPYLLLTGLGFLLSAGFYARMIAGQARTDPVTLNLSGAAHFIVGMTVLVNHFAWSTALEAAVTLVGAAAALKGAGLIVLPEMAARSPALGKNGLRFSSLAFVAIGSYCVMGYRLIG
ncbi:hypothetical protein ACFQEX_09920 [Roseibium salinum]|uniref:hypothetical protein n=1 Tax=Roseibium salinum TaxID=1604349 RepID=UPI00360C80FA